MVDSRTLHVTRFDQMFHSRAEHDRRLRSNCRPTLIFRDLPTCLNFDPGAPSQPCERCSSFQLLPEAKRGLCHSASFHSLERARRDDRCTCLASRSDKAMRRWLEAKLNRLGGEEKSNAGS